MIVSEVFGPTFQGEGPRLGRRCAFVRLMACNLSCSWCDTPYTWDAKRFDLRAEGMVMRPDEVATAVDAMQVDELIVTGGEPLLHQKRKDWPDFLQVMGDRYRITVETNGTLLPNDASLQCVAWFSVSPKLQHSGDPWPKRLVPAALQQFARLSREDRAWFKFVAAHPDDLQEVDEIVHAYDVPRHAVWIMPEGIDAQAINAHSAAVADATLDRQYNLTTRLHVLTWGNTRGV